MGDLLDVEVAVPFIVFVSLVIMVAIPFYFRHRSRRLVYETIKSVVEKTGTADPQLIAAITNDSIGPNADLRKGVLLICIAGGLSVFGVLSGESEVMGPMLGIAAFPGLIGAAYLFFHFFAPREPTV